MEIQDYPDSCPSIKKLTEGMDSAGFQASHLFRAVEIIKKMRKEKATVFFTFTANMMASGLRGLFTGLAKNKFIDAVITTGGSLDHDLIRSYSNYLHGSFFMDDKKLHEEGTNRIGNILVPNDRYVLLEEKMKPVFEKLYSKNKIVSPSEISKEIGNLIKNKNSFLYWCSKNEIPVYSPGITDSAIGLQTYFFKQKYPDFVIDVTKDMKELASLSLNSEKTGGIILGGGISKHHAIGVNLLRGGLDYAVYITTASPWDGSLSGARTSEAVSWGKIKEEATSVTLDGDATVVFPLIYYSLFSK
ncbi:deoxyhypusine synthase [Candidatus Micrarchaeota archaeon]|nr:deoxyhypusine synthase [Candidatus Micrarchaeota archaeon]